MAAVLGNDSNNWLTGTGGADVIKGYGGNDTLKGGGGADQLYGGTGVDTALYADSPEGVFVDLMYNVGRYGTAQGDTYFSIENVHGSAYQDVLHGDNNSNSLYGLDGDDFLYGHGGADLLDGGYGNDLLTGGSGADTLDGGPGYDLVDYSTSTAGVTAHLSGSPGYWGDAQDDKLYNVEGVYGSYYGDMLLGSSTANSLSGQAGNDSLYGFGGDDSLSGGTGNDILYGHEGTDWLYGNDGLDMLYGGLDTDYLFGGSGPDVFVWERTSDMGATYPNFDVIMDFDPFYDRIDLRLIDANEMVPGDQGFTFSNGGTFTRPGQIIYQVSGGDTYIYLNTDNNPDIDGGIRVEGIHTVNVNWFLNL